YWALAKHGLDRLIPPHPSLGSELFTSHFDHVYERTECRYGGILGGVMAAYVFRWPPARRWIARPAARWGALAFFVVAAALGALAFRGPTPPSGTRVLLVYAIFPYLFALLVAVVLLA